jgi:hypothetical protein
MNEKGKVLENSRINNNLKHVGKFFDENINDEKTHVVMESSSVWYNRVISNSGQPYQLYFTGSHRVDLLSGPRINIQNKGLEYQGMGGKIPEPMRRKVLRERFEGLPR